MDSDIPELTNDFQSLPAEYQHVIRLAQETNKITISPLQLLVGGWSGAVVYLVSVAWNETKRVEHCILKIDRKSKNAKSDEVTRHNTVMEKAAPEFTRAHIAELVFDRIEHEGAIVIFYRIAGESLQKYRPLSNYERQTQLKSIFAETNRILLSEWNQGSIFEQAVHPQKILEKWLGFRLDEGGSIERFIQEKADVNVAGFLINGHVFPNPLLYARKMEPWSKVRSMDVATGFIHGDLNTNNILVKFADDKETVAGYYLIDFALFKENMPLLYDQRYLEMSYLMLAMAQVSFAKCVDFLSLLAVADVPDPHKVAIEFSGVSAVIGSARGVFGDWVQANHPSLHDDLWGQYWLAGVAAGLAYCHKVGQPEEQRLAGLIYAAANLKRYAAVFKLPQPTNVELLYDANQAAASSATKKPKHNLPVQPTLFIGRAAQLTALKEMILNPDVRLITLMGPGGTGKTRLSLQVAQESLEHFQNGVFFVPLADDTDSNQFISRIAQQLEVKEGGRPLLENVKDYLRDKNILLVMDNFEQIVSAAPVVAELLAFAPQLKIITSSRIALQLQGEHEYPVPPLDLPNAESDVSVEDLLGHESVILFVERARTALPNFALTKDNTSFVAEICRRLDGLPLALELAAARVKLLSPQAILSRLDDQLKLLTGGARDLPTRHQTLRNTLEWSYNLLNEGEKKLYARLSVFVGGFMLEAAEAVCNPDGKLDILDGVTSLLNNSLLRQEEMSNGEPRFSMMETIRAYAVERLNESGESDALHAGHARYFGNIILNEAGPQLYSANAPHWLSWLEREHDNIRATLRWSQSNPTMLEFAAGLVMSLIWFWYRRGYFNEGRMWSGQLLTSPELKTFGAPRAIALVANGLMAMWQGEQDFALAQFKESQKIWNDLNNEQYKALITLGNGIALINKGNDREAQPMLQESQKLFKEQNQSFFYVLSIVHLGNVELGMGNTEQARILHEEAQIEARALKDNWLLSFALNNLGEVARVQGNYDLARKYYEESDSLLTDTGDDGDKARFVHNLGYIAQYEEEFDLAEKQFSKSLKMFRRLGNRRGMTECMAGLAGLKARQGQTEWGAVLLTAAESLLKVTGGAWWPADRVEVERNEEMIRTALGDEKWMAAQKKGAAMTLEQALAFASES
jgi:predicted ATPase